MQKKNYLTLVEILLSLALISVCIGGLFFGLQQHLRVKTRQVNESRQRYSEYFLQEKLGELIFSLEKKNNSFFFSIQGLSPPFHREYKALIGGYIRGKEIMSASQKNFFALFVDEANSLRLLTVKNEVKKLQTLAEEVDDVSYRFFDSHEEAVWVESWDKGKNRFPDAVYLDVIIKGEKIPLFFLINQGNIPAQISYTEQALKIEILSFKS